MASPIISPALRLQPGYEQLLDEGRTAVRGVPFIGELCYQCMHSIKAGIKDALSPQVMFTDLGLKYVGPIDGHDEHAVEAALRQRRGFNAPVIVHVVTRKGMGYAPGRGRRGRADALHGRDRPAHRAGRRRWRRPAGRRCSPRS